jgi:hypothetical protein
MCQGQPTKYTSGFFTSTLHLIEFLLPMAYSHLHYLYREATWYLILCNPKVAFYQLHYDEPNYITDNKPHMQSMFESLKPSLDICYTILNQILYYMQQLDPGFCGGFLQDCLLCLQLNVHAPC